MNVVADLLSFRVQREIFALVIRYKQRSLDYARDDKMLGMGII